MIVKFCGGSRLSHIHTQMDRALTLEKAYIILGVENTPYS